MMAATAAAIFCVVAFASWECAERTRSALGLTVILCTRTRHRESPPKASATGGGQSGGSSGSGNGVGGGSGSGSSSGGRDEGGGGDRPTGLRQINMLGHGLGRERNESMRSIDVPMTARATDEAALNSTIDVPSAGRACGCVVVGED